jgi:TatA/E family protein of Tat protein translocase
MPHVLLIFEFLGTTELMVIALVALIIFGPRKLPEIGRTVGKSIAEFKRASDDFKRTWEYEVEVERRRPALDAPQTPNEHEAAAVDTSTAAAQGADEFLGRAPQYDIGGETIARAPSSSYVEHAAVETNAGVVVEGEDEINAS